MYCRESLVSFLRKHDVIEIRLKQKGNVLCVVQPTVFNAWCVLDTCSKLAATFALFPVLSLRYTHAQLRSFYRLSTFDGSHVRKNTRLSPHVQLQYRVPEQRSLGTRLVHSLSSFYSSNPRPSKG